ncbi:MAG: hypothetical protein ACK595_14585 [Planctomycetota bacterium]
MRASWLLPWFGSWLACALPAQDATPPAGPAAAAAPVLTLQNLARTARKEGAAVVVPFAPGAVRELPDLHVPATPTCWQPFGARWPDGSLRQALCLFVAELPAGGERSLALAPGPGPALPTGPIAMPAATLVFTATVAGAVARAEPERVADLEDNALRRVELRRARLGDTGLLAEAIVTAWRDQPHAQCDVAVWFSDPRTPALQCDVEELAIECDGMALALRHDGALGVAHAATATGSRSVLLRGRPLGDGQGLRRTGALVPAMRGDRSLADQTTFAAATSPLLGATTWRDSGAFGPFGVVPELPPWLRGPALRAHLSRELAAFVARDKGNGDPFGCFRFGLQRFAGQTGDQAEFGVVKLSLVAATGLPTELLEAELSVLQEACRPVHFFEADGRPVEPDEHPDWNVWSGRTHWHAGMSKDRLGKPVPEPRFESHGWTGKDREHWSSNTLGAFALLTGAHWAREELRNEGRLYRAGQTIDPRFSTSHAGAPRGAGRTALAAAWNVLATGDERLAARMDARMGQVYAREWSGRDLPPDRVRPMQVCDPDGRMLQGKHRYWNPWQDATAAIGFAAQARVTGDATAARLAEALAANAVRFGWLVTPQHHEVAMALRWLDGAPLTDAQWRAGDPTLVQGSANTAFSEWSVGAVEIARAAAVRAGYTAVAARCADNQRRILMPRRPPPDGGLDRFAEWDAVRWP